MEFANENVYFSQDRINLKNKIKSPFESSKHHNKRALSDVKNLIHQKNTNVDSSNWSLSYLKPDPSCFDSVIKNLKSPKPKKSTSKSKETALNNMNDEFFVCTACCFTHTEDDEFYNIIPDNLRLNKDEINIFATCENRYTPSEIDLSISPIDLDKKVFDAIITDSCDLSYETPSFMDLLNESFEITVPQVSAEQLMI